jgi:hypothetical protein
MATITINTRTKAGKMLLEIAKLLSESSKGIIIESAVNKEVKTKSHYNQRFVSMIKQSAKQKTGKTINPNDVWGSLK